ncbi:Arylsulfatase precursor [Caulifigura coniformis]|uniref:Arylsulfatase n=1 Tax=Caulifigura coniformis TaxID=2527983 RepID=A0A517SAW8_9PLAN|nr:sulfatase-like hydrolase/transferase [Caulifigura coniformis]QDT53262.1 Arylsulfatase precursor [Caulifigura coniformis]
MRSHQAAQAVGLCFLLVGSASAAEQVRPNIVLIIADDLGRGEPGCYGGDLPTPNIDSLAAAGIRFNAGYVTAPFCAASRAALLTGRYQNRYGFEFNPIGAANADPEVGLPLYETTLPDLLRLAGYSTALIGKWHLGGTAAFHPQRRGFDEFFGFLHEGHTYVPSPFEGHVTWLRRRRLPDGGVGRWTSPDGRMIWSTHLNSFEPDYDADNPILRSSQPVDERENLTDAFTREAERFLERNRSQPFFLCLSYNAVHSPIQARSDDLGKFAHIEDIHRRLFASMLSHLDDGIGRVVHKLRELGIEENTLVVFLSDNGGPTRELTSSNHPFRGQKGQLFEGGIRVPMIMKWPARYPKGRVEERMVSALDLLPTATAAAGLTGLQGLDGVDLTPALSTDSTDEIHAGHYWRVGESAAYRAGDWKILCRFHEAGLPVWELFNLKDDPAESTNLAAKNPEQVDRLERAWRVLNNRMIPPNWLQGGRRTTQDERDAARHLFNAPQRMIP